jgi:inosine-uridine nucleoside N-ribohydrolase
MALRRFAILFLLLFCAAAGAAPIPVTLDTDIGDDIDDALALAFALQSPELDVRAVITVLQHRERRADLAWKILELYGRTDVPVGMGAEQPLLTPPRTGPVGQTAALGPSDRMPDSRRQNGVRLLIETCLNSREKITVLAYGPLTNIALALRSEPRLSQCIERIVLMNGVFFQSGIEYNTERDPEAAAVVFGSGLPVTTVGLDVTMQCRLSESDMRSIASSQLATVKFLHELIRIWQGGHAEHRPILHDPLAVGATISPDLIKTETGTVEVETRGVTDRTYGMTILRKSAGGPVRVASEVDAPRFVKLFMERVLNPPRARAAR